MKEINNQFYNTSNWHAENEPAYLLKGMVNPCRVSYFKKIISNTKNFDPDKLKALEVGCGGGILTEEIAKMGFRTTGIDISKNAIKQANDHALLKQLNINYKIGDALELPIENNEFDAVFCCDVLEHLPDLNKAITEISRVLKPEGIFFYDTINRTFLSKLVTIKIAQEWKRFAFMPENLHVWEMFIKPKELEKILKENCIKNQDIKGMKINVNPLKMLTYLRKRARGLLTYKELTEKVFFIESPADLNISYMGYGIKMANQVN